MAAGSRAASARRPRSRSALLLTIALTAAGVRLSSVPTPLTNVAQVLLGCALGARFDRTFLIVAPRYVPPSRPRSR
jgi:uncharacterized membrane protein AbrB (regulator of aidB expression)